MPIQARRQKAERTKHVGSPIELPGKPLAIRLRGNDLWVAQSDAVIRRIDLEVYKFMNYEGSLPKDLTTN